MPWKALTRQQVINKQFTKRDEWKRHQLGEEETRESAARAFQAYIMPIKTVTYFKYLRRVMMALEKDWTEVLGNLWEARENRYWMTSILGRDYAIPRVLGMFFKAVVQAVLLFGSETWVTTPRMGRDLGGFQQRVARRINGRQPKR